MAAPDQAQHPPGQSQLTREEARVMRECNQESFYSRCVPMSAVLMAGTFYMVRTGRWRGSASFGPAPKMAAAGVIGYIGGKLSYIDKCKGRLMELPDSKIGQMLRLREQQRRDGVVPTQAGFSELTPAASQAPAEPEPAPSVWPLPPQRADNAGLDDYYRPTLDSPETLQSLTTDDLPASQQHTTYEQLRRQNRAEVETRLRRGTADPAGSQYQPPAPARQPPPPPSAPAAGKVNKYGDSWDD